MQIQIKMQTQNAGHPKFCKALMSTFDQKQVSVKENDKKFPANLAKNVHFVRL